MKSLLRLLGLTGLVVCLNLNAQIPTDDDFTTEMRWQVINNPPKIPTGNAYTSFTTTSGQMNYLVSSGTAKDTAGRFWFPAVGPSDSDWSVNVDVNLSSEIDAKLTEEGQYVNLNLGVAFSNYSMMMSIDRYRDGSGIVYGFEAYNGIEPIGENTLYPLTSGTLRVSYIAASSTLTAQFSNPSVSGGSLQTVGTMNTSSWGMSPSDTFNIILVGGSGFSHPTLSGTGPTIADDTAFFSTFGSNGLEARTAPVPEPSTYAAIIGLLALGFAIYRRRG